MVHTVDLPAITQTFSPYLPKEDIHWDTRFALQKELRIIECDGNFVLYNTVLNNPIVLNQNARNAVSELDQKTLRELAQDPEHWELAELLIEAFHLLPVPPEYPQDLRRQECRISPIGSRWPIHQNAGPAPFGGMQLWLSPLHRP